MLKCFLISDMGFILTYQEAGNWQDAAPAGVNNAHSGRLKTQG